jgi:6-phosphogluconolactonase/glucosamine-6-phosphate isomerase/deaminase
LKNKTIPSTNVVLPDTSLPLVRKLPTQSRSFHSSLKKDRIWSDFSFFLYTNVQNECVKDYSNRLNQLLSKSKTQTADLVTLGLGEDGHIASIFPTLDKSLHDKAVDPAMYFHQTNNTKQNLFLKVLIIFVH